MNKGTSVQCLYVHRAAVTKVQPRVPEGGRLVTLTKVQGKVLGGGQLVVMDKQSDGLEIKAVYQSWFGLLRSLMIFLDFL
jgi:hypothetical protein